MILLNLEKNRIKKLENLDNLVSLKELYLKQNEITVIKNLKKLQSLEALDLSGNKIEEIKGLLELKSLKFADLQGNPVTRITKQDLSLLKKINSPMNEHDFIFQGVKEGRIKVVG